MDRVALDAAYNNTVAVADSTQWIARWTDASAKLRQTPSARLDIAYGKRPRARLDYLPCQATRAPLFVFIHGGYWQRNDKDMFTCMAEGPLARGFDVALPGYTLGPDARLRDIVGEINDALTFLAEHSKNFGFDRDRLFVGGWSAGGHLTAAVCSHPTFAGGVPISGIFDLEPVALNYLNEKLNLDASEIAELSPLRALPSRMPPLRLFAGGKELPELQRQSIDYAQAARESALPVDLTILPGHNHYSILEELRRPDGAITRALSALAGEGEYE
ncbi:MAG: alpha/beta hydrolase [Proteobacteria bacterium]|nr:MAG: alpha/beta hydrolase [Pseudomonadota bacterium]